MTERTTPPNPEQAGGYPPQWGGDGRVEVPERLRGLRELATTNGLAKLGEVLPPEHFITVNREPHRPSDDTGTLPRRTPRPDGGPITEAGKWPSKGDEQQNNNPKDDTQEE